MPNYINYYYFLVMFWSKAKNNYIFKYKNKKSDCLESLLVFWCFQILFNQIKVFLFFIFYFFIFLFFLFVLGKEELLESSTL